MRRGAAVLAGLVVLTTLSGCTSPAASTRTLWPPSLTFALEAHCLTEVQFAGPLELHDDATGWTIKAGTSTITNEPDQIGSIGPARQQATGSGPVEGDTLALLTLERCMTHYSIDYSLVYTDDISQRVALYDWDVSTLLPCLTRAGWHPHAPPSRAVYAAEPYGTYEPYAAVLTAASLGQARRTLASCPYAAPETLAHARSVAAARGIPAVR